MSNLLPESMLAEIRARAEVVPLEPPFSHGAFAIADRRKLLAHIDACSPAGARVEPGDDPAVLREYLRIYGGHIPPCAGRPCECGFAKAWQVSRLPEPSRGVDTAALNRELCEKEGHVLGVVARPCLRCHEWFDPQYGRSPEPSEKPKEWHDEQAISHSLDCSTWKQLRQLVDEKRHALRTEQEMHAAWRKRATEAEAELQALKSSGEPVAKPNPCRNECSLISLDDDHWKCNHCDAVFAYTGAQKPVEKPRCWWPLCKETAGDALCDAVQSALTKGEKP